MKLSYPVLFLALVAGVATAAGAQVANPAPSNNSPATASSGTGGAAAATQMPPQGTPAGSANEQDDNYDPLLAPPPLPKGKVTLIGGTVRHIDQIRNKLALQAFGGGTYKFNFDERTHIYRDGTEVTQLAIHPGERAYVDSMLDSGKLFARNIHIETTTEPASASGQLMEYDSRHGIMVLRDSLSSQPVSFRVTPTTAIRQHDSSPGTASDFKPGALIAVKFAPDRADRGVAREISIIAEPGNVFTFSGPISFLDLHSGVLAVNNKTDNRIYDIHFDQAKTPVTDEWKVGAPVTIQAKFDANGYTADSVTVQKQGAEQPDAEKPAGTASPQTIPPQTAAPQAAPPDQSSQPH